MNLRELAERDLAFTLEDAVNGFALPIIFKDAQGNVQSVNGQIVYDTKVIDPETGEPVAIWRAVVTVRLSSLSPRPNQGERWLVSVPLEPSVTADKVDLVWETPYESCATIGFIRMYLTEIEQSP